MNEAMKNTVSFIQIAQLKDELSEAHKVIDCVVSERDKAISEKEFAVSEAVQEFKEQIARMQDDFQRTVEQMNEMHRLQINEIKETHRKDLIVKEVEIQRLRESQEENIVPEG